MITYADYVLSKGEKMQLTGGLILALAAFGLLFYRSILLALFYPFFHQKAEQLYAAHLGAKRKKKLLTEFRDFLFSLSASFSTGRHMTEAMKEAEVTLIQIYGHNSLFAVELQWMIKSIEETGQSAQSVFSQFAKRSDLEDIEMFADVYSICRETGGDITTAVNKAASVLTEKINLEMEIQTMLSQKKLEGTMIAAMPSAMILFLWTMSPEYLEPMYTTATGRVLMSLAFVCNVAAYIWMEKMTNVEL